MLTAMRRGSAAAMLLASGGVVSACESALELDQFVITRAIRCGDQLVDPVADEQNCGACGRQCPKGASCEASACLCPPATTDCQTACAVLLTDTDHCGGCGHACSIPGALQQCNDGSCTATACKPLAADCDADLSQHEGGNGCEVDIGSDEQNCGACGAKCAVEKICKGGECVCDVPTDGGECDPRTLCGCDPSQNCAFDDGSESWRCVPAGASAQGQTCKSSLQCARGNGCVLGVCQPYCTGTTPCATSCVNTKVNGWGYCPTACMPVPGYPGKTCSPGQQCIAPVGAKFTQCGAPAGSAPNGTACSNQEDCAPGLVCMGECRPFCVVSGGGGGCSGYDECVQFSANERVLVEGVEIGWCKRQKACGEQCSSTSDCASPLSCVHWTSQPASCAPSQCDGCNGTCYFDQGTCSYSHCKKN